MYNAVKIISSFLLLIGIWNQTDNMWETARVFSVWQRSAESQLEWCFTLALPSLSWLSEYVTTNLSSLWPSDNTLQLKSSQ